MGCTLVGRPPLRAPGLPDLPGPDTGARVFLQAWTSASSSGSVPEGSLPHVPKVPRMNLITRKVLTDPKVTDVVESNSVRCVENEGRQRAVFSIRGSEIDVALVCGVGWGKGL